MHHGNRLAGRSCNHINLFINFGKLFFQNYHRKNRSSGRDIAGFDGDAVCCNHTGACVALGRTHRNTRLQIAADIEKSRALLSQISAIVACRCYTRENVENIPRQSLYFANRIKFFNHFGIICICLAVNREHTRRLADADSFYARQFPMNIARKRCEIVNIGNMLLAVENSLVQMSNAPPLRNIEIKQGSEFLSRRSGGGITPSSEFGKLIAVFIERQIAVHHSRKSE